MSRTYTGARRKRTNTPADNRRRAVEFRHAKYARKPAVKETPKHAFGISADEPARIETEQTSILGEKHTPQPAEILNEVKTKAVYLFNFLKDKVMTLLKTEEEIEQELAEEESEEEAAEVRETDAGLIADGEAESAEEAEEPVTQAEEIPAEAADTEEAAETEDIPAETAEETPVPETEEPEEVLKETPADIAEVTETEDVPAETAEETPAEEIPAEVTEEVPAEEPEITETEPETEEAPADEAEETSAEVTEAAETEEVPSEEPEVTETEPETEETPAEEDSPKSTRESRRQKRIEKKNAVLDAIIDTPRSNIFQMILRPGLAMTKSGMVDYPVLSQVSVLILNIFKWFACGAFIANLIASLINLYQFSFVRMNFSDISSLSVRIGAFGLAAEYFSYILIATVCGLFRHEVYLRKITDVQARSAAAEGTLFVIATVLISRHLGAAFAVFITGAVMGFMLKGYGLDLAMKDRVSKTGQLFLCAVCIAVCTMASFVYFKFVSGDLIRIFMDILNI